MLGQAARRVRRCHTPSCWRQRCPWRTPSCTPLAAATIPEGAQPGTRTAGQVLAPPEVLGISSGPQPDCTPKASKWLSGACPLVLLQSFNTKHCQAWTAPRRHKPQAASARGRGRRTRSFGTRLATRCRRSTRCVPTWRRRQRRQTPSAGDSGTAVNYPFPALTNPVTLVLVLQIFPPVTCTPVTCTGSCKQYCSRVLRGVGGSAYSKCIGRVAHQSM